MKLGPLTLHQEVIPIPYGVKTDLVVAYHGNTLHRLGTKCTLSFHQTVKESALYLDRVAPSQRDGDKMSHSHSAHSTILVQ